MWTSYRLIQLGPFAYTVSRGQTWRERETHTRGGKQHKTHQQMESHACTLLAYYDLRPVHSSPTHGHYIHNQSHVTGAPIHHRQQTRVSQRRRHDPPSNAFACKVGEEGAHRRGRRGSIVTGTSMLEKVECSHVASISSHSVGSIRIYSETWPNEA